MEQAEKIDWVSQRCGDGTGYDILSFEENDTARFIEVKTTNGGSLNFNSPNPNGRNGFSPVCRPGSMAPNAVSKSAGNIAGTSPRSVHTARNR